MEAYRQEKRLINAQSKQKLGTYQHIKMILTLGYMRHQTYLQVEIFSCPLEI